MNCHRNERQETILGVVSFSRPPLPRRTLASSRTQGEPLFLLKMLQKAVPSFPHPPALPWAKKKERIVRPVPEGEKEGGTEGGREEWKECVSLGASKVRGKDKFERQGRVMQPQSL